MAVNPSSWGVLGNPSKEKIKEYSTMPVGGFKSLVSNLSRRQRGKKMQEFTVYVTKRDVTSTRGVIKATAFDFSEAATIARQRQEEVVWDNEPYRINFQEYVHSNIDPLKYKT